MTRVLLSKRWERCTNMNSDQIQKPERACTAVRVHLRSALNHATPAGVWAFKASPGHKCE